MALTINGRSKEDIGRADFLALGEAVGGRPRAVERALDERCDHVISWLGDVATLPFDGGRLDKLRRVRILLVEPRPPTIREACDVQPGRSGKMKICAYLNFDGNAEEAFRFYAQALGGTLSEINRFGSMPEDAGFQLTDEQKDLVMHVGIDLPDGQLLMASDVIEGMGQHVAGNNVAISVHPDSRADADRMFAALGEGGTVTMPLADQFWGDYYGSLTDRFGINWMVNYSEAGVQQA